MTSNCSFNFKALKDVTWFEPATEGKSSTRCQNICSKLTPRAQKILSNGIWLLSIGRNAVIVIVCALMAYGFNPDLPNEPTRNTTFILTGNLKSGIPKFQLPPFSINNTATGVITDFGGMISELGSAVIILPLMAVLENIAIAKAFGKW